MAIKFSGEFEVKKNPEEVYDFLTDPNRFAALLPDYQNLTVEDPTHFTLKVNVGISYIKGSADVKVELTENERPRHALYKGQGVVAGGNVTVIAAFDLAPVGDGATPAPAIATNVKWQGEAQIFGRSGIRGRRHARTAGQETDSETDRRIAGSVRVSCVARSCPEPSRSEMCAAAKNIMASENENAANESVAGQRAGAKGNIAAVAGSRAALPRKEEDRLLRGRGKFADDIKLRGMLYLCFVRSSFAHARVVSIDTSAAEALPGFVCAITGKELAAQTQPFIEIGPDHAQKIRDFPMAVGKALYQGEPVAAVVAESPSLAEDAAELVQVEYEPLEPVVEAEQALTDHSILHEEAGTNRVWNGVWEYGDVERAFKEAAYVVDIDRLHFHRFSSTPLENNVVIAEWNPKDDRIYYWCNNSFPSFAIQFLAAHLNIHIDKIRVQTFDIGGSFGIKITSYPQMAVCVLPLKKAGGRPVKLVGVKRVSEHMVSSAHGNERTFRNTRVALDKNGVITAIDSRHIDDCGAYPRYEPLGCVIWSQVFCGVYRFKNARIDFWQAVTNKCPVGPNRGYSRMQHLWFLERVVDICAHEIGIPPDEMRLRNYILPEEFPYTTPNGCVYDSGNYPKMLAVAKDLIGWDSWKKKQAEARHENDNDKDGRMIGIGIGTTSLDFAGPTTSDSRKSSIPTRLFPATFRRGRIASFRYLRRKWW